MARPPLPPALVLAAGRGERLTPLTTVRAKPAVPIAGVPLVVRLLTGLARQGVPEAVLNLHHRPESITREVGHGRGLGLTIRYSWEPVLLGSGGGPRRARELLPSRFLIVNGDTLVDLDLWALLEAHRDTGARVTLAVSDNPDPSRYGGVTVDARDRVTGFAAPGRAALHFVGVQIVESDVFDPLPPDRPSSTVGGLYDAILSTTPGAIAVHRAAGVTFREVGTLADYLEVSAAVATAEGRPAPWIGARSVVDDTATLTGTAVWDDVVVEARCHLVDCVVTDGVRVPADTRHHGMVLTRDGLEHRATPLERPG